MSLLDQVSLKKKFDPYISFFSSDEKQGLMPVGGLI